MENITREYLTIYEVAEILGFHHNTIRKMVKTGKLKATQCNNREWRISRTDLKRYMNEE